jgi:hypothetical protein
MAEFEEIFLNRWSTREDTDMLYDMKEEETYKQEKELPRDCIEGDKDLIEEREHEEVSHEDEVMMYAPPLDEVIQASIPPTKKEQNVVSYFPFQVFDDALSYDSEGEEIKEPLDVLDPSCHNKGNDVISNIDEFIHVGRCKLDVICYDGDPIYGIEGHFQLFPLR